MRTQGNVFYQENTRPRTLSFNLSCGPVYIMTCHPLITHVHIQPHIMYSFADTHTHTHTHNDLPYSLARSNMSGNDLTNLTNGSKKTPTSPSPSKGVKVQ